MSWLTDLFGGKAGKSKQVAQEVYFPSQDPSYNLVKKNLEDLIAARGFGYTPSMISSTTAPYATARREGIKNYEIPLISSQASARGLGRSTIPINRIALSQQEGERDIEQRIAELTTQSEQLKANQYQNALSGMTGLSAAEIDAQNKARGYAAEATNVNRAANAQMNQNIGLFGAQMISPFVSEAFKTLTPTKTGEPYEADWGGAIDKALTKKDNSALVNISKGTDSNSLMQILKLLATSGGMPA